ncbi:MAG: hypothetical protein QGE97_01345 [SAR324 cluster bacterium]|nr:hypothetical protein [SAR324 cluster bacterium]
MLISDMMVFSLAVFLLLITPGPGVLLASAFVDGTEGSLASVTG